MNLINGQAPKKFIAEMKAGIGQIGAIDPKKASQWIYQRRVSKREKPSQLGWLNQLVQTGMEGMGHIDNDLYVDLLSDKYSTDEMGRFLRSYYWGSGFGFQRVVLKAAIKFHDHPIWKKYIMDIITEENTPSSHCDIFKKFVVDQGYDVGTITASAEAFNKKMTAGYTSRLDHAFGYALGIETEADYQISLLAIAYTGKFSGALSLTDFFEIHMSESGEEEHAKETCLAIESLLITEKDFLPENVIAGFKQAIADTTDYALAIRSDVYSQTISNSNTSDLQNRLKKILKEVAELKADFDILPELKLSSDLGIDSLKLIDVVLSVEREFDVELSELNIANSRTVSELMKEVTRATTQN
jgi:acyl carrier protein